MTRFWGPESGPILGPRFLCPRNGRTCWAPRGRRMPQKGLGGPNKPQGAPGSLLEPPEVSWGLLGPPGTSRGVLGTPPVSCICWGLPGLLGSLGVSWGLLGPPGGSCGLLPLSGPQLDSYLHKVGPTNANLRALVVVFELNRKHAPGPSWVSWASLGPPAASCGLLGHLGLLEAWGLLGPPAAHGYRDGYWYTYRCRYR